MTTNMDLPSFRSASILYGIVGEKVPDAEGITDTSDIIKVGLTGLDRSAAARVGEYVRSKCIAPGAVHFLFDSESDGALIDFNGKAFETVTHFMVSVMFHCALFATAPHRGNNLQIRTFSLTRVYSGSCKCGSNHREFFEIGESYAFDTDDGRELQLMQIGECFVYLLQEWVKENVEPPTDDESD